MIPNFRYFKHCNLHISQQNNNFAACLKLRISMKNIKIYEPDDKMVTLIKDNYSVL